MNINRRTFMQVATAAGVGATPCFSIASPSKKLRVAVIGGGMRGCWNLVPQVLGEDLVASVDPDKNNFPRTFERIKHFDPTRDVSKIQTFSDYRVMFYKPGPSLDAVVIATPNHQHALPALMAIRRHFHVFVGRPMPPTVNEIRRFRGNHMGDFFLAIREKRPAGCCFDYSEPLAETVLLANVAMRTGRKKLLRDGKTGKCPNVPEANSFPGATCRKGWGSTKTG